MTSVPPITLTNAGALAPLESEIVAGLWADFQAAFGGNLNESIATPQGQLVSSLAAILGASNDLFMQYLNGIDPALSSGRMQDAIARMSYLTRIPAQATIAVCTCAGRAGTVIPAGSQAVALDGTVYVSGSDATIPVGGSVSVTFSAMQTGPIACPAGSLNRIYRAVTGWDSITNPADGTIGRDVETAADFEARRAASVAANAVGLPQAVRGAVMAVPGVTDSYVYDNATASSVTVGGVSIPARSIYVCAFGGADADVAKAIWSKKSGGCGYTGNTTVTVHDTNGYSAPYPSYAVTFQRPSALPIYISVVLANNGLIPGDALGKVQRAVIDAFSGVDGGARARIGSTIYATRFIGPIQALGSWVEIISIAIGTAPSPTGSSVTVSIDQVPSISSANIAVTTA